MKLSREPTVFVVDDDAALRKSLCWLIESINLKVKAFSSARAFLDSYDPATPGCLVLDVRMPGMSGLELQTKLSEDSCTIPIIVITGYGDVPMAVRAMKGGAIDFIEKPVSDQVLLDRIQQAIAEDSKRRAVNQEQSEFLERLELLTPREREVLRMVVAGMSSREIGQDLDVSFKTIEAHRAKIMKKMQATGVPHLVRMAIQAGFK
ncbi:MAG TPA: response regulator transcription factor [Planctomycetaceae bacterium]|nr:response regulator transcription factor [Planctomycetaceae bacterium]